MTIAAPPPGLQPEDYDAIEAALAETARGRAFLAEYARRISAAEGARTLAAIERLEARLEAQQALAPAEAFTLADRLIALSWSLRERGAEDFVCGKIEALAREFRGAGGVAKGSLVPEQAPPTEEIERTLQKSPEAPVARLAPRIAPDAGAGPPTPAPPTIDRRLAALSWLDRLPLVDRFALFA